MKQPSSENWEERRRFPRHTILQGIPISTEIETMNKILRSCKCVNLGTQGALIDFGEDQCPELPVHSKLFLSIHLAGESVKLPGIVRHRYGSRMGIYFPIEGDPHYEEEQKVFAIILRTLERGIERRSRR
ncbi:PilZ domain-containing protein [Candidatus Nitronereus thalassa]|uniref:PilZ domain-containing protein n=2 Tax=Candidatus Nitronereus thalassa TaxID=3020898 RepID=A0ABU3K4C7_9BACT|nr:PilZ domain-containing protein [Candidatus Nitronereus thalassa]MDT7041246.1 PilZ domain-containing protein [Candidatus Nitronereus thalassa]